MNAAQKKKFRHTKEWQNFRQKMRRRYYKADAITGEALMRDWELHHLDLNPDNYDNLEDESHFRPLNKRTHEAVHTLYRIYKKDKGVLLRIQSLLDMMLELNTRR